VEDAGGARVSFLSAPGCQVRGKEGAFYSQPSSAARHERVVPARVRSVDLNTSKRNRTGWFARTVVSCTIGLRGGMRVVQSDKYVHICCHVLTFWQRPTFMSGLASSFVHTSIGSSPAVGYSRRCRGAAPAALAHTVAALARLETAAIALAAPPVLASACSGTSGRNSGPRCYLWATAPPRPYLASPLPPFIVALCELVLVLRVSLHRRAFAPPLRELAERAP